VDHEGEVLDSFFTKKHDRKAGLKLLRKAMRKHDRTEGIVLADFGPIVLP